MACYIYQLHSNNGTTKMKRTSDCSVAGSAAELYTDYWLQIY